ncbi:MAG: hypothetical protein ISS28_08005 [Candidatus Cloacimonetes bacterium]|nr:hypothetical protein [Candidatus Cloacimonadota bacterium]
MFNKFLTLIVLLCLSHSLYAAIESITIEGPDIIYPGSDNKYHCVARYDYGGSSGYYVSADWEITKVKPDWIDYANYLSLGFNRVEVAYHVDYEFEFTLKCTYEEHKD